MQNIFWTALVAGTLAALVTSLGICTTRRFTDWGESNTTYFMCFAAGVLISASFLHIIPKSFAMRPQSTIWLLIGLLGLHLFNRFLTVFACEMDPGKKVNRMIAFGPVPSRRLGRSLGVNNIPPKICTYACAYCQLGRTLKLQARRQAFYKPEAVLSAVQDRVTKAMQAGEPIDYLTFVPDGEPTLDINLGTEIKYLKDLNRPIGVITNVSLIWRQDVREHLLNADWVSLKIDTIQEETWRRINHPHKSLELGAIMEDALQFAKAYEGTLVTETMLVAGVNDNEDQIVEIADYLARLQPGVAYLSIPTRPPAKKWVRVPDEQVLNRAYQRFRERGPRVEFLIGYEGNAFAYTGDIEQDLLSITAVHPMRQDAVNDYLSSINAYGKELPMETTVNHMEQSIYPTIHQITVPTRFSDIPP